MSADIYDDIAPLYDHEVEGAIADLLVDPGFQHAVKYIMPQIDWAEFSAVMTRYKVKYDFQSEMIYNTVWMLARKSTTSLKGDCWEKISRDKQHLFLSNHRDIVLDAGFLNILRHEQGLDTTEIAIGDNLLIHPWIEKLVKMNKSFIVRRGLGIREQLISSKHMADYIHYAIAEKGESVWMAQREGRAKDSNDRTQDSILKMLTLGARGSFVECIKELNIMPVSISYEYDPCDYLKAKEFQLKRDNPEYKKSQRDDLLNMEIGILGFKGNVLFRFGDCINDKLDGMTATDRRGQIDEVVKIIDKIIHSNYEFHEANYVAYDLLNDTSRFADKYTADDVAKFEEYIKKQLAKIDLDYIDFDFCRNKMLIMYSNTLKNHLVAIEQ